MKRLIVVITGLLIVTACGSVEADKEDRFSGGDSSINIKTDKETDCKYIIYTGYREDSITPLLKKDGTPDCE